MKPYHPITLFAPSPPSARSGSTSVVVSVIAHVAGCAWLFFGLSHTPQIKSQSTLQRFNVRVLNAPAIEPPPPPRRVLSASRAAHSFSRAQRAAAQELAAGAAPAPAPMPSVAAQLPKVIHQNQTLIQPDAPPDILLQHKTPVPTVFTWTPVVTIKPVIQAPLQKPVLAKLRPSLDPPNREVNLADVRMSSTPFATALPALPPSTTTPIVVRGPDPVKQVPETASKPAQEPAPARVLSLSDLQAEEGPVAIPLANATARPNNSDSLSAGRGANPTEGAHGNSASKQPGVALGQGPGASGDKGAGQGSTGLAAKGPTGNGANADKGPVGSGANADKGPGNGAGNGLASVTAGPGRDSSGGGEGLASLGPISHFSLPRDGQFGVVVVGSSLAEQYPETVGIWSGRLVYTVYLHVGPGKSWILQYSLPPSAGIATAGSVTRPEAPWPYDIVRPRFAPDDFNSEALMVHGFVNSSGRFERLALVFPAEFAKVKFLLNALQQWEFRPARENGQVAQVEVLLIIPEEIE